MYQSDNHPRSLKLNDGSFLQNKPYLSVMVDRERTPRSAIDIFATSVRDGTVYFPDKLRENVFKLRENDIIVRVNVLMDSLGIGFIREDSEHPDFVDSKEIKYCEIAEYIEDDYTLEIETNDGGIGNAEAYSVFIRPGCEMHLEWGYTPPDPRYGRLTKATEVSEFHTEYCHDDFKVDLTTGFTNGVSFDIVTTKPVPDEILELDSEFNCSSRAIRFHHKPRTKPFPNSLSPLIPMSQLT